MARKILSIYFVFYLLMAGFAPLRTAYAQEDKTYNMVVMNLEAQGVSEVEAAVLSDKLRSYIMQVIASEEYRQMEDKDQYVVLEREDMDKILDEFDFQNTGCVSDSCMIEFGKMMAADRMLLGSIGKIGSTYSVSARILDLEISTNIAIADGQLRGSIDDVMSTLIVQVGNDLIFGKKKKSRKLWYLLAGVVIAGAGAGAMMSGGDEGKVAAAPPPQLPTPPERP